MRVTERVIRNMRKNRAGRLPTCTKVISLDILTSTDIFIPSPTTGAVVPNPPGASPYLGAMLVGIVNLNPSTSASCFNSIIYSISTFTFSPAPIFPRLVLNTSVVCCSSKLAGSYRLRAARYVVLASPFSFIVPSITLVPIWHRKETTAHDS